MRKLSLRRVIVLACDNALQGTLPLSSYVTMGSHFPWLNMDCLLHKNDVNTAPASLWYQLRQASMGFLSFMTPEWSRDKRKPPPP
jgi:hypothetical protein